MNVIPFKSKPNYFKKERDDIKPNTVRFFDNEQDNRKILLDKFIKNPETMLYVRMYSTQDDENFLRKVVDVTKFESMYIISWINLEKLTDIEKNIANEAYSLGKGYFYERNKTNKAKLYKEMQEACLKIKQTQ